MVNKFENMTDPIVMNSAIKYNKTRPKTPDSSATAIDKQLSPITTTTIEGPKENAVVVQNNGEAVPGIVKDKIDNKKAQNSGFH